MKCIVYICEQLTDVLEESVREEEIRSEKNEWQQLSANRHSHNDAIS